MLSRPFSSGSVLERYNNILDNIMFIARTYETVTVAMATISFSIRENIVSGTERGSQQNKHREIGYWIDKVSSTYIAALNPWLVQDLYFEIMRKASKWGK
jgi:hypothetical protein